MALACSMSMNAQIMKVMKGNVVVATYTAEQADNVVFEEAYAFGTGTAKRTGDINVKWVQLWENGPKIAEYNVGASSATENGAHYCWGSSIDKDPAVAYKSGSDALTGDDDTATNLWGSNWRMPTKAEFDALLANCDVVWTDNYKESGVKGVIVTGKGDYASNSVFLPAADFCVNGVPSGNDRGDYWSSTPNGNTAHAYYLQFDSGSQFTNYRYRYRGSSVRAVLAE